MFTFAHLSDPHLPLPPVRLGELLSKRATGWLSWTKRRKFIHRPEALAATITDIRAANPDHIVVTGDIVNISTPAEYLEAAGWLARLGRPEDVTVIPGNHDAYVQLTGNGGMKSWVPYMTGDDSSGIGSSGFPFVRRRGRLAFIGLSTALPMPVFVAAGTLGHEQIGRLEQALPELAAEAVCRIVLIHHPPQAGGAPRRKGLTDAGEFRAMIARHGAELILHGHNHRVQLGYLPSPAGNVAVLGAASASAAPGSRYGAGGYNLIRVMHDDAGWTIDVEVRVIRTDLAGCDVLQRFRLTAPRFPALASAA